MRLISTRTCAAVLATGAVSAVILAMWPYVVWDEDRLPSHWRERIGRAPDNEAATMVHRLAPTSPAAARVLVELAASPRAAVAQAAQGRLDEWMFSVERRTAGVLGGAGPTVAETARAISSSLAKAADRFGPGGGRWAGQFSRRLLDLVHALPHADRVELIQDCQAVLEAVEDGRRLAGEAISRSRAGVVLAEIEVSERHTVSAADAMLHLALQSGPPAAGPSSRGGAVATGPAGTPDDVDAQTPVPVPNGNKPGALPEPAAEELVLVGPDLPTASGPGLGWRSQDLHFARVRPPEQAAGPATLDVPSPDETETLEKELRGAPLPDVLEALASRDPFTSASAAAALRARGMSEADLKVARRLPGADATARLALLEEVALLPGASTEAWLHHFAADESPDIRLRALTLLGTSRDEAVVRRVRARAIQDEDPRVRALASRLEVAGTVTR